MILFGMIGCQHRTVIQTLYSLILYPAQAMTYALSVLLKT